MLLAAVSNYGSSIIVGIIVAVFGTLLLLLIRACLKIFTDEQEKLNERIEKAKNLMFKGFKRMVDAHNKMGKAVERIENSLGGGTTSGSSRRKLSDVGQQILAESGMANLVNEYQTQLLEKIREQNPETAYDVEEVTRDVFREFDFKENNVKKLKDYAFNSGLWVLADILDVGAIHFRDIALKELGLEVKAK